MRSSPKREQPEVETYVVRAAAAADIQRAYEWYERQRGGLGEEFLAEVRASMDAVLSIPGAFPILHRETRRALVHRFPYGLFFRVANDVVVFVACYHTRRAPASWKRRK